MSKFIARYNKLYIKVILLVGLLFIVSLGFVYARGRVTKKATEGRVEQYREERINAFNSSIDSMYELERILARDYTVWDEMVESVKRVDHKWLSENVDTGLQTYDVTDAWVYDTSFKVIHRAADNTLPRPPIDLAKINKDLFKNGYFVDFFTTNNQDIYKVFVAPIQPTVDIDRKTVPQGYLMVADKLDSEFISKVETVNGISLNLRTGKTTYEPDELDQGKIKFALPMYGWQGNEIAYYSATVQTTFLQSLLNDYNYQYWLFAYGLLIAILAVGFVVQIMVVNPLRRITQAMRVGESKNLESMTTRGDELGDVARLVKSNIKQNDELKAAYALKQKAEQNAQARSEQFERANNLMVGRELRMVELKKEISELKQKLKDQGVES